VGALIAAFRRWTPRRGFCALGSVKSNIGHASPAAGVAGLIKTALALEHGEIPPTLNCARPNPIIDFAGGPFYVATELRPWPATEGTPRRAGVSALGFGGTNAHVVTEEAPAQPGGSPGRPWHLVTLSARTPAALSAQAQRLARSLRDTPGVPLADVTHTLHVGRRQLRSRLAVVCRSAEDAAAALESLDPRRIMTGRAARERPVGFMFPGHGSQHLNMTRGLYEGEPFFRERVDACAERLAPLLGSDLRRILYPAPGEEEAAAAMLAQTRYVQPALFTVEYALGGLWMRWGLRPDGMIGYSIGEYAAACLAGIFDLPDALAVVVARADLAQQLPEGAMLAAALSEAELEPLLGSGLSLAAVSAPAHCIVAGLPGRIDTLRQELASRGVACKRLTLTRAFHSEMMDPLLARYREVIRGVRLHPPSLALVSGVTGTWLRPEEATDPEHWVRELRGTVRFSPGIAVLADDPRRVFLEVGPSNLLGALVRGHSAVAGDHVVVSSCRAPAEDVADGSALLAAAGKLWLAGCSIDWSGFYSGQRRRRVPLPTYPFERQRYWIEPAERSAESRSAESRPAGPILSASPQVEAAAPSAEAAVPSVPVPGRPRPRLATPYLAPASPVEQRVAAIWQELLGIGDVGVHDRLFELGGDSLVAVQLVSRVRDTLRVEVPLAAFLEMPTVHGLAIVVTGSMARQDGGTGLGEAPRFTEGPALPDPRP
ncbi:MAG: acyltransferase domain-containing protein, partial [Gemmatimonadales bacterium]|nr:acyltransferase domain-containing protein [Gemmatimonadales bacterium]